MSAWLPLWGLNASAGVIEAISARPAIVLPGVCPLSAAHLRPEPLPPLHVDLSHDGGFSLPALAISDDLRRQNASLAKAQRQLAQAVGEGVPALAASVNAGDWNGPGTTLSQPCCGDAAPKLALLLRHMGLPVDLVESKVHFFVVWNLDGGQLFADPSIRQFFGWERAPARIPNVFVGSRVALEQLFVSGYKTTRMSVPAIYFADAATRNARIAELQRDAPIRPDLAPLARFVTDRIVKRKSASSSGLP